MPALPDTLDDLQNILRLYVELRGSVQSYQNIAAVERNKFDKAFNEKRARETQKKYDIDFDSKFSSYAYHAQSVRRCREKMVLVDEQLVPMLSSYSNRFFYLMEKDTNIRAHCATTRNHIRNLVLHLDAIMNDNKLFQVYKVFDSLRRLVTRFDNWYFVLNQTVADLGDLMSRK
jgi:hypothetical protein